MDRSLELWQVAAGILQDVTNLSTSVGYTPDANRVRITFYNYPLYGGGSGSGPVCVEVPRDTLTYRGGMVRFKTVCQSHCRFYQEKIGKSLCHPHIYNDGHPCWNNDGQRNSFPDFLSTVIAELFLTNVTHDSVTIGKCASGVMGVRAEALRNAQRQHALLVRALSPNPAVDNDAQLHALMGRMWSERLTHYLKYRSA